jgi:cysteine-rich repeat protein
VFRPALAAILVAGLAVAADHPIGGDRLTLKDPVAKPERRTFRFKANKEPNVEPSLAADPRAVGATLEVVGRGAGDGSSGVVTLDAAHWEGLGQPPGAKGFKWIDPLVPAGVRKVFFKPGSNGGQLTATGKGLAWAYALAQPQGGPVDVRFTVGSDVWCARFGTFQQNLIGKLRAAAAPPPADCAVPSVDVCGNGTVGGTEECDDGGTVSGDGCSATCELESPSAVCAGVPSAAGTALDSAAVASGLDRPIDVQSPRLDPRRLFVVEQSGRIRLVKDGALLPTPFVDLTSKTATTCPFSERGLLGLAFDPDYETNGFFYVNYTNPSGTTVIARYTATGDPRTADSAAIGTEVVLRTMAQPFANHNGGQLQFGPDGALYVGMGDGGSGCDPGGRAQNDAELLGKMLRIDVDALAADPLDEIWAKGLRNPWRFSFDRATGDLYVADVGQLQREEVNVVPSPVPAGLNYGWDFYEGEQCANALSCPDSVCPASTAGFTMPVLTFSHAGACSISGGYVYRGCALPGLHGTYFYSDFCGAFVRTFQYAGGVATNQQDRTADVDPPGADTITTVVSFGQDARGELYVVERGDCSSSNGVVYKLVPQP